MKRFRLVIPNLFTAASFLLGVWVILLATGSMRSPLATKIDLIFACHLVVICALLDKLDGFAAKILNASSEFGAQFDSLADLVAFGLAPAFCVVNAYQQFSPAWYAEHKLLLMFCLAVYVLCAAVRLARYNAVDADAHPDWFVGLPSTFVGALNALLLILVHQYATFEDGSRYLATPAFVFLVTGLLMVAPLYLPKLKVRRNKVINAVQLVGIVTGYVLGLAMIYSEIILALVVVYAVVGMAAGLLYRRDVRALKVAGEVRSRQSTV